MNPVVWNYGWYLVVMMTVVWVTSVGAKGGVFTLGPGILYKRIESNLGRGICRPALLVGDYFVQVSFALQDFNGYLIFKLQTEMIFRQTGNDDKSRSSVALLVNAKLLPQLKCAMSLGTVADVFDLTGAWASTCVGSYTQSVAWESDVVVL